MENHKIELKITTDSEDKKISLTNLSLYSAKSLVVLIDSIINIIENTPNSEGTRIAIREGSAVVEAACNETQYQFIKTDLQAILEKKSQNSKIIKYWGNVQNKVALNGLNYEINFITGGNTEPYLDKFKNSKKFQAKRSNRNKNFELVFLNGEFRNSGGSNPNIHVVLPDKTCVVHGEREDISKITKNFDMYKPIHLSAWCNKSNPEKLKYVLCDTYKIENYFFQFNEFFDKVKDLEESEEYYNIHLKIKEYIDKSEFGVLNKFLRFFLHESTDIGALKTILLITKRFKENEQIKSNRAKIKDLFDKKILNKK